MSYCDGNSGVLQKCATQAATAGLTADNCKTKCATWPTSGDKNFSCWLKHLGFAAQNDPTHCPHATGTNTDGTCNAIPQ
jgi:hypothetical protein